MTAMAAMLSITGLGVAQNSAQANTRTDDSLKPAGNEHGAARECVVNRTGKYAVTNGVYERGYRYASLGVKSQSGNGTAKGVWSPDCAGSYTILN